LFFTPLFYTLGDLALEKAFEKRGWVHILCRWHINEDLKKHLPRLHSGNPDQSFFEGFQNLFYISLESEFNDQIDLLLVPYSKDDKIHQYLTKRLISRKEKWGGPWVKKLPSLGLVTTQLAEITHRSLKMKLDSRTPIEQAIDVIINFSEVRVIFKTNKFKLK